MKWTPIFFAAFLLAVTPASGSAESSLFEQADKLHQQGFYNDAIDAWKKVLATSLEPDREILARIRLTLAHFHLGHIGEAIETAEQLAKDHPDSYHAQFNLGNIMNATSQFSKSVPAFEKVVELQPDEGLGYIGLALSQYGNHDSESALANLWKVKKIFKEKKNISWHRDTQLMIAQIKHFAEYPPHFADLWIKNNCQKVRVTYEKELLDP